MGPLAQLHSFPLHALVIPSRLLAKLGLILYIRYVHKLSVPALVLVTRPLSGESSVATCGEPCRHKQGDGQRLGMSRDLTGAALSLGLLGHNVSNSSCTPIGPYNNFMLVQPHRPTLDQRNRLSSVWHPECVFAHLFSYHRMFR